MEMMSDVSTVVSQSYNSSPKYTEIKAGLPEDYKDIKTLDQVLVNDYLTNTRKVLKSQHKW